MNSKINSIWLDWREKVPDGVPNPFNDYHLALLKEVCLEQGIDTQIIDDVILVLEKTSTVTQDAKKAGLQSLGGGYYSKSGKKPATHKSSDGKLVGLGKKDVAKKKEKPKGVGVFDKPEEKPTDDVDRDSQFYKKAKSNFDVNMKNLSKQINFETEEEKEIFNKVLNKIEQGDLNFTDDEKRVAQRYIAKSDSKRAYKFYVAKKAPETYDDKTTRGQIVFTDKQTSFIDDITNKLNLGLAPAQAQKTSSGKRVVSKVRSKDLTPTEINSPEDLNVKTKLDSNGNVSSIVFGNGEHKIKSIPDKQKLKDALIKTGMSEEDAEKKSKRVRRAIKKHNEYLISISQDRDKFTVSTMIDGADPSTKEGRNTILNEYPKKLADIFEKIVKSSEEGISEDEQKVMDRIRNLDPNLSTEEYEKECMEIMHDAITTNPALSSGSADLAENLIALIQTRKGHEVYFPADVTYAVGDMICLGAIGDLNPTAEDYYDRLADEATSIIVTVEDEGPGSVKVGEGAASAAAEKVKLTEYKNPKTRQVLYNMISTHTEDLFKYDAKKKDSVRPITSEELERAKKKIDEGENHAREIGVSQERIDEINEKAKTQAKKWRDMYMRKRPKGTTNWTDEDFDNFEKNAEQFLRAHLFIGEVNNTDMDYQKFSNFRVDNTKTKGASMSRTDGLDCLGTMKPAPNMGFSFTDHGRFKPANTYAGRIGNSCKDKKKK